MFRLSAVQSSMGAWRDKSTGRLLLTCALLGACFPPYPSPAAARSDVHADPRASGAGAIARNTDGDDDLDDVHEAVERGEIQPLSVLRHSVEQAYAGDIIGIDVEREGGRWLYEFKIVNREGRLLEVQVDASTATILKVENK